MDALTLANQLAEHLNSMDRGQYLMLCMALTQSGPVTIDPLQFSKDAAILPPRVELHVVEERIILRFAVPE